MSNSLFGHLAMRFTSSPENLATEALSYIFNSSPAARESFANLLGHFQVNMTSDLKYETQGHSQHDPAIPDLVAMDANRQEVILGEAKFWAGLTEHQPVTYIHRLQKTGGQALIVFVPAARIPYVWGELEHRCQAAGIALEEQPSENQEILHARTSTNKILILMSWRVLLASLHQSLSTRGDLAMAGNVEQLQGLCEQMDTSAFLPLQAEELTSQASRRYLQYSDLVDEVTDILVRERIASVKGLRATARKDCYIRYMNIQNHGGSLAFNAQLWSNYRATPIWLGIVSREWQFDVDAKKKLAALEIEIPPRLFVEDNWIYVPILLESGLEKGELVAGMIKQIKEVIELLKIDDFT